MKVLIDRNIEINAITHKSILVEQSTKWGDKTLASKVLQRKYFKPNKNEVFRIEQIPYLASICLWARDKKISLYTSNEIIMEKVRQRGHYRGYVGFNLMEGVKLGKVNGPVARTIIYGCHGNIGTTEKEQMDFFRSIKDERFFEISGAVDKKRIDDAYHLWTAEVNKLDVFLTMDKKFLEDVARNKLKIKSSVDVLTPKELCERLNIEASNVDELAELRPPFS